jgi:hypothetical protein
MKRIRIVQLASALAAVVAILGTAEEASAQKTDKPAKGQPYEIGPVIVTARPTRPSAVVELGKILPEIEIAKIRQPFLSKIEEALSGEPF